MACRIGITTDPERREGEWRAEYPGLYGWEVFDWYDTKTAAQAAETYLARLHGCQASPGGGGEEYAQWAVYRFYY